MNRLLPRSGETNGRPIYENIINTPEAQDPGVWSRRDDNSPDPNAPGAEAWTRGYLFGTNAYDQWNGRMTLVMRIRDLGTYPVSNPSGDSQKSVVDITTTESGSDANYWTLGHVNGVQGPAGWEFGQTDDGRNANGLSDVRTGGFNEWVIIRITVEDTNPDDDRSVVRGWQNGELVYESVRGNDIATGQFGEIAFRRTSGGNAQLMEIDWVVLEIGSAWAPGEGPETPAGRFDRSKNAVTLDDTEHVNGAVGMDVYGVLRTIHDPSLLPETNELFRVNEFGNPEVFGFRPDANGIPTQVNLLNFFLGFRAYTDFETLAAPSDALNGILALDKYGAVHSSTVRILTSPDPGPPPQFNPNANYFDDVVRYNQMNPDNPVFLPYFPFDLEIPAIDGLGLSPSVFGAAQDVELAVDWRTVTHAFQGYYILDAFAGVHYVNNAEILAMLSRNEAPAPGGTGEYSAGSDIFRNLFGFRPLYKWDYAGENQPPRAAPASSSSEITDSDCT